MKNLTAKNIKKFETSDGYAWSASFFLDGKKIGIARNDGHGGETETHGIDNDAFKLIEAHAATLPHFGKELGMDIAQDADMVLENAMWDTLAIRRTTALLKKKVVAQTGSNIYEWKIAPHTIEAIKNHVLGKYPDAKILNDMPIDEASLLLNPVAA